MQYLIVIEKTDTGYSAYSPDLPGCISTTERVLALPEIALPTIVVGELLFGAENSKRPLENLPRYLEFISACEVVSLGRETATIYDEKWTPFGKLGR
jgi:tRNA(fMet)-specific endonuclease VapC